jgi:2-polyprenyl-3-methyl-5-hydroxy-6-metoxy-1,4-benzoquinol methylase
MPDASPAPRLVPTWTDNADAWTRAVRDGAIASREAGTDAAIVEAVLDGLPPAGRVLDVGCGEGWLARALGALGAEVHGVDASAPLVAHAREAGGASFDVLDYDVAADDPARLGGPYDVAVFNFALLSDEVAPILRAAASRLEDGGRVVVQTVHPMAVGITPYRDGWHEETFASMGEGFAPMPWYFRTVGSWVRAFGAARLHVASLREPLHPETGLPLSLLFVAEPAA